MIRICYNQNILFGGDTLEAEKIIPKYSAFLSQYVNDIRFNTLKDELNNKLTETSTEAFRDLLNNESVLEMNNFLASNSLSREEIQLLQRLAIENITYTQLRTVYLEEFKTELNSENIAKKIKGVFCKKMAFLPENLKEGMKDSEYYNKILEINLREKKKMYIPALYEFGGKIFIFFVYKVDVKIDEDNFEEITNYATAIINLKERNISVHVKNDFGAIKANEAAVSSTSKFFVKVKDFIENEIGIKCIPRNAKEQKEKIFNYCKEMNSKIIEDYEAEVKKLIMSHQTDLNKVIGSISNTLKYTDSIEEKIHRKLNDIFVSEYMTENCDGLILRKKALEKGLYGYPTRIQYKSKDASISKTVSKGAGVPLPIHEIFHSINTVFKENSILNEVRIAWFNKYLFKSEEKYEKTSEVCQTSIDITNKYLAINFNAYSKTNKEMIEFVLQEIREVLS